ncbi:uncharacterized protein [Dysidea avara]|uniref:uncharacterized protein n=2 Tax=Dysidea avara TaxID=196820 RepID=UPI0033325800
MRVLQKGFKYIPYSTYTPKHLELDTSSLKANLTKRCVPYRYDIPKGGLMKTVSDVSKVTTPVSNAIDQFVNEVRVSCNIGTTQSGKDNINRRDRNILNKLCNRKDIRISKSDKGDTVVVETMECYTRDGLKHLSDQDIYHRIDKDLTSELHVKIKTFVNHCFSRGLINHEVYSFLTQDDKPRTPFIYFLKKLHKTPLAVRPIVSNIHSPTCLLSQFMDHLLKPIVATKTHILKNSIQVITEVEQLRIPNNSLLVTADVKSLYPSIPIEESINIILTELENYKDPTSPSILILKEMLSFILYNNCFTFGDLFFLQVRGIAMGTAMAPNYANLFMSNFEDKFIFNRNTRPVYYRRYIDDLLIIWKDTEEELIKFMDHLNNCHPTIKFTFESSTTEVTYLDINIVKENHQLYVKPHFKTTNTFSYLQTSSYHPKFTFKGIYRGENVRILRNCTKQSDYETTMNHIKKQFSVRGYATLDLPDIPFSERNNHLKKSDTTSQTRDNPIIIVSKFDINKKFVRACKDHWPMLTANSETKKHLYQKPVQHTFTNHKNIKQRLPNNKLDIEVPTDLTIHPSPTITSKQFPAKNIACRREDCACCSQLKGSARVISYQTQVSFDITNIYACDSVGVVYLLECVHCYKQYVGETSTTLRARMRRHRNMSNQATNRPLYHHLQEHKQTFAQTYKLSILDRIVDTPARKAKEMWFIQQFKTKIPFGFNVIT